MSPKKEAAFPDELVDQLLANYKTRMPSSASSRSISKTASPRCNLHSRWLIPSAVYTHRRTFSRNAFRGRNSSSVLTALPRRL